MINFLPLLQKDRCLLSSDTAFIAENTFSFSKKVLAPTEFSVPLFELTGSSEDERPAFSVDGEDLISYVVVNHEIPNDLFSMTYHRLINLPGNHFEIRTQDHIVTEEGNFRDQWGEPTLLINELEKGLPVVKPFFNNNKVFSNREDHFSLENLHVDLFLEHGTDEQGSRPKIWRYFLNLSYDDRQLVVCLHHPKMVDVYFGLDDRHDNLKVFIEEMNEVIPGLLLNIKGRKSHRIYGYKILATHLLHAPYNKKRDFMAIINTMA